MPFPDSKSTAWEFFTDDDIWAATAGFRRYGPDIPSRKQQRFVMIPTN